MTAPNHEPLQAPLRKRLDHLRRVHASKLKGDAEPLLYAPRADHTLPENPVLWYIRASSREGKEKELSRGQQTDSPEAQRAKLQQFCERRGYLKPGEAPAKVFVERRSAKRFDWRAVYKELREYVGDNPRADRAVVVFFDVDRFTRELKPDGTPNLDSIMEQFGWFRTKGWHLDFSETPMEHGADLMNYMMLTMKAWGAAEFSRVLGVRVCLAKKKAAEDGRLVGGKPPYPAMRVDSRNPARALQYGEHSPNGSFLARDPRYYPTWEWAAKKVAYEGWSCGRVAEHLDRISAPLPPWIHRWTSGQVKRMLTNTALIAKPVVFLSETRQATFAKAGWEPVVDVQLFADASAALERYSSPRDNGVPRRNYRTEATASFLLAPVCEACGGAYYPDIWSERAYPDRRVYRYVHRTTTVRSGAHNYNEEWIAKAKACGCRKWAVDADTLHRAVVGQIVKYRTSSEFVEDMLAQQRTLSTRIEEARRFADDRYKVWQDLQRDYEEFLGNIGQIKNPKVLANLDAITTEKESAVEVARQQWLLAQEDVGDTSDGMVDFRARVNFTEQVANAWDEATIDQKRQVIEWWVDSVQVKPGPTDRRRTKEDEQFIVVSLRLNPERPFAAKLKRAEDKRRKLMARKGCVVGEQENVFLMSRACSPKVERFTISLTA